MKRAVPAFVFAFLAFVCFLLVTVTAPFIGGLRLAKVTNVADGTLGMNLGVFGVCYPSHATLFAIPVANQACTTPTYPYKLNSEFFGSTSNTSTAVLDNLNPTSDDFLQNDFSTLVYGVSKALILNPFAAAFALVALIPSIVTVFTTWRFTQILTTIFLTIAMLCSWVSFIINIVFAALVRSRIKSATNGAYKGAIGNAVWISLAGAIIMTIATLMALIGSVCCVKRRKEPEEAPLHPEHEVGPVDSHEFAGEKNHHGLETEQPAPKKSFKFWGKKQQQPVVATTV